ncbi:MAG: type VI secretion system tip protein TssI/VgrG [Planctomycetota bacterium]
MALAQENRILRVATPLGADAFALTAFRGRESLSELFEFELDLVTDADDLDIPSLVGKNVTCEVALGTAEPRFFNGFVRRIRFTGADTLKVRHYRAEIVPWLWFLTLRSDFRVFQEMNVPDIVQKVFTESGFTDFDAGGITGSYPTLEYCVQMGETDFDFVSRLLEEEGIFYFFTFENGRHVLKLADSTAAYSDCSIADLHYTPNKPGRDQVTDWQHGLEYVSGKWSLCDFDFTKPNTRLGTGVDTVLTLPNKAVVERYEYPGRYVEKAHGDDKAKAYMEADEARHDIAGGSGACPAFTPTAKFTLHHQQYATDDGKSFVVTAVEHAATESGFEQKGSSSTSYSDRFTCIPSSVRFRPQRLAPRPIVRGPQTAIVVGPQGEEIHTDKYGRIKVQFHWDRVGKYDDKSSCWIRVAQSTAGKQWGAQVLPRVGQEVVVEFIDGDPDRPLVTGAVYNANTMPSYELPANKTQSGYRSRSSKGGGTSEINEIRFEDKKGSEHIFIHAQKDEHHRVLNDRIEFIGNDEHVEIKKDSKSKIGGERHLTLAGDDFQKLDGNRSEDIGGDRKTKIGGNDGLAVGGDLAQKVTGDHSLKITGAHKLKAKDVHGNADMNLNLKAGMNWAAEAGMNLHIKGGMNVVVEAGMQLTLKAGPGFVVIGPSGVQISGPMVMINSGGAAGAGGGCSPQAPGDPAAPDAPAAPSEPMALTAAADATAASAAAAAAAQAELEFTAIETSASTAQTAAFEAAAENGTPFCEECS